MKLKNLGSITEKLLVFGGPYSNLAATRALQARASELDIPAERIICTGDMVAYCAEPEQTLELIQQWGIHVVMGNCEEALAFSEPDCGCGFDADSNCSSLAITWYRYADRRVTVEQRRWMRDLPRSIEFVVGARAFKVVHGSLSSINEFVFASSDAPTKLAQIRQAEVDAIIGGHCGIPFGQGIDNLFWLNAGVIGMPANDGGSHGWYMLIEPVAGGAEVSWQRLNYDYATSQRTTMAAGMTEYGQALADGCWPNIDILPTAESRQSGQPLDLPTLRI
jgi:predicted phosphodiesterase